MPKFSVKKPLTVFVTVLAILVLGVVAYLKMTPDLLPNMNFPYVIIMTTDPGASPETVEADITKPIEQTMATLNDIKTVTSSSQDSVSMVVLEFEDTVSMDSIGVDIQQKLSALEGSWGDTVGAPYVLKMNPSMLPVDVVAISYKGKDVNDLSDFVEDTLTPKLEGITGVASVSVSGAVERQVHVVLSQEKLDALSRRLSEAVNRQLDEAARQLSAAKAQLESAQQSMESTQEQAVSGAVMQALESVRQALEQLQKQQEDTGKELNALLELADRMARLQQKQAEYDRRIQEVEDDASLTPAQKAEEIAAIRAEPEYVQLQAEIAEVTLLLRGYGTDWDHVQERIEQLQKQLDEINRQLDDFVNNEDTVAKIAGQITEGTLTLADGAQQLIAANIQLSSAMAQIESGFDTLEQTRTQAASQTDMSSVLSLSTVSALLTAQNFSMPAGYIQQDGVSYMVSVGDTITTREELENLVLFDLGIEGVEPVRLSDAADIAVTDNAGSLYTKLNGDNGVIASFSKQSTYATAEVSDNISARFAQLEQEYSGLHFTSLMDQGEYIYIIINAILSSLGWGALFAIVILYLFLKEWRPTVITLVAIPVSVIFAVVLMYFSGVTLNMISLSGLAVAVGMLVDNSVVVIENIYRLRAKGASVYQAAVAGAQQVLGAITSSTLTTVCVFLPIVFVEGLTKQLFTDLALTITYSLLASLIVALTLVPAMASGMLKKQKEPKPGLLDKVYPAYRKAVRWSLGHKAAVLLLAVVLLVASAGLSMARGFSFMPDIDMNTVNLTITMPEGCDRETAVALADEVVRRAMTVENVETVGAMMSSGSGMSAGMLSGGSGGSYDVTAYVTLPEGKSGNKAGAAIEALCEDMECKVEASGSADSMMSYMTGDGISLKIYGDDMEDLQDAARQLGETIEGVEGTASVSNGLEDAAPAIHITVDRAKAMEHGMTVAQIYIQVASALSTSADQGSLTLNGQSMDVVIALPEEKNLTVDELTDLELTASSSAAGSSMSSASGMSGMSGMSGSSGMSGMSSASGMGGTSAASGMSSGSGTGAESFKLGEVATVEETVSMNAIARSQQRRYITVTAQVADGYNVTKVSSAVESAVAQVSLPEGVTASFDGENEMIMDAMQQLLLMLALGILLVYLVMVAQFQSLKSPLIVMFTIPLAFTGGFAMLLITGVEVSVVSLIGFVMLVGIIVNNGIVLVDYINQLRLEGMERQDAIVEAGITRLRPILMTSITTILGLVVMAFGGDAGTALMQPVALVCMGGLLYATLMTLLVVPCMYDIISRKELRRVDDSQVTYEEEDSTLS